MARSWILTTAVLAQGLAATLLPADARETVPALDRRAAVRTLDTPCTFTAPRDRETWLARARFLREQVLVSAGLWPLPERTPLAPHVEGRVVRGDYSVEKVWFESRPGFLVTGNLYRPLGRTGPFPAVLSPHGHWDYGRLENSAVASVPGRCITLARQGYVVFSYDMVGYNDSRQVDHRLIDPTLAQWGIGSLGLHLWNSIRGLDFLESLPDVDRTRIGCTGASGGGTQAFLLAAVDDRVAVSAPVNMISHTMQGGDVCENAPNLRLDTSNLELGALAAPRPMLMVSATGDWTKDTPRVEFPAVRGVYALLGAADRVATVQFAAEHNYNRDSRQAVYGWFGRWLLGGEGGAAAVNEPEFVAEQPSKLLVFFGRAQPVEAKTQTQIVAELVAEAKARLEALRPRDASGLARFREQVGPAYRHALAAGWPEAARLLQTAVQPASPGASDLVIGRAGVGDRVPVRLWSPRSSRSADAVLVVDPGGIAGVQTRAGSLIGRLRAQGFLVASIDAFNTGTAVTPRDTSDPFFTTYNRTDDANRVQDVLTALAWLRARPDVRRLSLVGLGRAGLWCLLAQGLAPRLDAVVADADRFPSERDEAYLGPVFVPLLRKAGAFDTALLLTLGARVLVHDTGGVFDTARVEDSARLCGRSGLSVSTRKLDDAEVLAALSRGR
ncbi:MAG TPA: acetylxylan esterase [Vicinamibacteria bacterium]|nr:acetylxylan esterase [Vicinamibacteria bacterium]